MIRYKLLDNGFCVFEVEIDDTCKELEFMIDGATNDAALTVRYVPQEREYFRPIENGKAKVPAPDRDCKMLVSVLKDGNVSHATSLNVIVLHNRIVVTYDLDEIQEMVTKSQQKITELSDENKRLDERITKCEERLEKFYEGYDIE